MTASNNPAPYIVRKMKEGSWEVVAPSGNTIGSFVSKSDAEKWCRRVNGAYSLGYAKGRAEAVSPVA